MAVVKGKNKNRITAEFKAGKGYIRIVSYVEEYTSASSYNVRQEVDRLLAHGVKECEVYINSRGGDVFEATEIANELTRIETVSILVGAVAASAVTYLCAKFPTTVKSNSQVMVHRPRLYTSGTIDEVESDLKLLKNITEDYKNAYAAKTGKTPEEIEALWAKGDYWMTAQEAKEQGFVDAIETDAEAITEEDVALLTACAAPHIPKPIIQNKNSKQMDRLKLIAMLGLPADATDEQIESAVKANKQDAESAANLQANAEKSAKVKAEALADKAIVDKIASADERESIVKLAAVDYDGTKALLEKRTATPKLSASLDRKSAGGSVEAGRENWTLDDYLDKDPDAYAKMKEDEPEHAAKLEAAYFGKKVK